jgi:hypothetical protein
LRIEFKEGSGHSGVEIGFGFGFCIIIGLKVCGGGSGMRRSKGIPLLLRCSLLRWIVCGAGEKNSLYEIGLVS